MNYHMQEEEREEGATKLFSSLFSKLERFKYSFRIAFSVSKKKKKLMFSERIEEAFKSQRWAQSCKKFRRAYLGA